MFDDFTIETDEVEWSMGAWCIQFINSKGSESEATLCCSECGEPVGAVGNGEDFTCGCDDEPGVWKMENEEDVGRSEYRDGDISFRDDVEY